MSKSYKTQKLDETEELERTVLLDNRLVSTREFNDNLEKLRNNQKIIETKENQFYTVERFFD